MGYLQWSSLNQQSKGLVAKEEDSNKVGSSSDAYDGLSRGRDYVTLIASEE